MHYFGLAGLLACIAVAVLALALRLGGRLGWLVPWLRGNAVLLLIAVAVLSALAALDLSRFQPIAQGAQIATFEIRELDPQRFELTMSAKGSERTLVVNGDMWDMDVQVIRWRGVAALLGLGDGYRLDRLMGRFVALEQQQSGAGLQPERLNDTPRWRDVWHWIDEAEPPLVQADAFIVRFLPLIDGARFALEIGPTGVSPIPLNPTAEETFQTNR